MLMFAVFSLSELFNCKDLIRVMALNVLLEKEKIFFMAVVLLTYLVSQFFIIIKKTKLF